MENAIFFETIIAPKGNFYLIPLITTIFLLLMIGLIVGMIFATKNTNISIKGNEIVINSFIYGRKIPIKNILIDEVRAINLKEDKEFSVSHRTNGIGFPGFTSGWVKLENKSKALVFITSKDSVLLMPTKDFILLFSMKNVDEFTKKMQELKQTGMSA